MLTLFTSEYGYATRRFEEATTTVRPGVVTSVGSAAQLRQVRRESAASSYRCSLGLFWLSGNVKHVPEFHVFSSPCASSVKVFATSFVLQSVGCRTMRITRLASA